MQRIQGDALRGHLENLILAVLQRGARRAWAGDPATIGSGGVRQLCASRKGRSIRRCIAWKRKDWSRPQWEDEAAGAKRGRGPRRRIYRLSPKGKRRLAKSRTEFVEFVQVIGGILGATT